MKNVAISVFVVAAILSLTGCSKNYESADISASGVRDYPSNPDYQIRRMKVDFGIGADVIYVIEKKDGTPVSGVSNNYLQGKKNRTVSSLVVDNNL